MSIPDVIGSDSTPMVDARMAWDSDTPVAVAQAVLDLDFRSFKELTEAGDQEVCSHFSDRRAVSPASGESIHAVSGHRYLMAPGSVSLPWPDAPALSGITLRLQVARWTRGLPVMSIRIPDVDACMWSVARNGGFVGADGFGLRPPPDEDAQRSRGDACLGESLGTSFDRGDQSLDECRALASLDRIRWTPSPYSSD